MPVDTTGHPRCIACRQRLDGPSGAPHVDVCATCNAVPRRVEEYLDELSRALSGRGRQRRRVVEETRAHLEDSIGGFAGTDLQRYAEAEATTRLGSPRVLAAMLPRPRPLRWLVAAGAAAFTIMLLAGTAARTDGDLAVAATSSVKLVSLQPTTPAMIPISGPRSCFWYAITVTDNAEVTVDQGWAGKPVDQLPATLSYSASPAHPRGVSVCFNWHGHERDPLHQYAHHPGLADRKVRVYALNKRTLVTTTVVVHYAIVRAIARPGGTTRGWFLTAVWARAAPSASESGRSWSAAATSAARPTWRH